VTLLAPWALWFGVLGAPVVALYLLKIKRKRAGVPALDFWRDLAGKTKVHSLFERLKRLLSLLLWLGIVACLVLALGNPLISVGRVRPRAIAIVLDNSASMQALEPEQQNQARLELARKAIAELTTRRPVSDEWLLIEAAREPRVVCPWTFDARSVREGAQGVAPFAGSGNLEAAVDLARQLSQGKPDPCVVVVSDGAAGAVEPLAKADPSLVYWPVGRATDNLGITRLAARPDRQLGNYQALVAVANASDQRVDTQVTLELDGSPHSVELVSVEPRATWEKTVTLELPISQDGTPRPGAILRAFLDRPDALSADNEAYAVLAPIRPAVVWLVSPPESAFFFEQALSSMTPLVSPEQSLTLSPAAFDELVPALASPALRSSLPTPPPDLVILNNCAPKSLPPSGRFLLVNAWPEGLPVTRGDELKSPQLFLAAKPHPLMQHITLQGARLLRAQKLTLSSPARVLAHTADADPLVVLLEEPGRQIVALAFDVLESDLPFRNAFPLLLRNTVAYFQEEAPTRLRPEYSVGAPIELTRALPPEVASVELGVLQGGKTRTQTVPAANAGAALADTSRPAAIRLKVGDEWSYAAINLADAGESRIAPVAAAADPARTLMLSGRLLGGLPWIALATVATVLVAFEWLTYHFRWTE
jgi:hypothetical protein